MKKLIALFVFFTSISAFAASINWGTEDSVFGPSGAALTSGYMYLVSVSAGSGAPTYSAGSWDMKGGSIVASAGFNTQWNAWVSYGQEMSVPVSGNDYYIIFSTATTPVADFADLIDGSQVLISSIGVGGDWPGVEAQAVLTQEHTQKRQRRARNLARRSLCFDRSVKQPSA